MKKIDTTEIVAGSAYPPSKKGLDFLQQSYQEAIANTVQALIGNVPSTTVGYVLYGCIKSDLGSGNYGYTKGAIYFNGEIYDFDAQTPVAIATADLIGISVGADPVADPTTFTDGTSKNVHDVRKMYVYDGTSGTGTVNFADLVFLQGDSAWSQVGTSGKPAYQNSWANGGLGIFYIKKGNIVHMVGDTSNVGSATTTVFTLPSGYRPSKGIVFPTLEVGSVDVARQGYVTTGGDVTVASAAVSGKRLNFYVSFPIF